MASNFQQAYPPAASADAACDAHEQTLLALLSGGNLAAAGTLARALTQRFARRGLSWKVYGALLWAEGRTDEALTAMQNSVELSPCDAEARCNLGLSLAKLERFADAEANLRLAIKLDPKFATAHYRLGMTMWLQARLPEAEASLRTGIALRAGYTEGDDEANYSNLLFLLSHNPSLDADSLFAEHCRFGEYFENRVSWPQHANRREPARRLNVGFVSGDLREHAVASFVEPLLRELRGRPGLKLQAYYNGGTEDEVSRRIMQLVEVWQPVGAWSNAQLADKITADEIDILIDLSGHTALNRLPAFARKPAPVQASTIGYPGTTGLRAMDYFIADPHLLPRGEFDRHFTERLVYLPGQTPFQPHPSAPAVTALPALAAGHMTFGSFNRPDKINDSSIDLWAQLLRLLPEARMILGGIRLESQRDRLIRRFADNRIARARLEIHPPYDMENYLALHQRIDVCLDTAPYNGGTTTLHALWMGVPTLTVAGSTPPARAGASILGQVGLHEFVTRSAAEFIAAGVSWSQRLPALGELRSQLRTRWRAAPGRRADVVADAFEAALRHMWRRWCAGLPPESFASSDVHLAAA